MENQIKKIFYFFNNTFFQSKLKFVNIQIDFKRKFCFNFDKNKNILFMGRCVFDESSFLTCLLHEMIHIFHLQKGKNDVGPNSYHKKVFMEECVEKGIFVVKHKSRGWSILMLDFPRNVVDARFVVQPSDLCIQKRINAFIFLKKTFNWEAFYDSTKKSLKTLEKTKSYNYKYICGCLPPQNSIRSGRNPNGFNPLKASCEECKMSFIGELER